MFSMFVSMGNTRQCMAYQLCRSLRTVWLWFWIYCLYALSLYIADGEHKTAHYAIATGFMALGMMLPGMVAGWIQDHIGYTNFFIWVCICTIPGIVASIMVKNKIDPSFGRKKINRS